MQSEEFALNQIIGLQGDWKDAEDLLYLNAIIDPKAHMTLDVEINSLAALKLVDLGAMGIFMHPRFAEKCNAILWLKVVLQEVKIIDGRMINSRLSMREIIVGCHWRSSRERLVANITNTMSSRESLS